MCQLPDLRAVTAAVMGKVVEITYTHFFLTTKTKNYTSWNLNLNLFFTVLEAGSCGVFRGNSTLYAVSHWLSPSTLRAYSSSLCSQRWKVPFLDEFLVGKISSSRGEPWLSNIWLHSSRKLSVYYCANY